MAVLVELGIVVVFMAGLAVAAARDGLVMVGLLVQVAVAAAIQAVVVLVGTITGELVVVVAHIAHLAQIHHQVHREHGKGTAK